MSFRPQEHYQRDNRVTKSATRRPRPARSAAAGRPGR